MLCARDRFRSVLTLAAASLLACAMHCAPALAAPVAMQAGPQVKLPDTGPARCAKAFLDVLNSPTLEHVTAFEKTWASKERQKQNTDEGRVHGLSELHQRFGTCIVANIITSSDDFISLGIETANGIAVEMEFNFAADEPGKLVSVSIASHSGPATRAQIISHAERDDIIHGTLDALREGYVYPETAERMAAAVEAKLAAGAYDEIKDDVQLARQLTTDLRDVSHDGHLGVRVMPAPPPSAEDEEDMGMSRDMMRRNNYAFQKVELLPGNIGYLRFDAFINDDEAKATASAALAFMQHADALIFDLRYNGGGSPEMIQYISSYLFGERTHLNDMIDRHGDIVEEFWTLDDVPGERFANDLPVYVLTSKRTFSGAEEFSYNLKNLKRGIIVGETTGGGAHPVSGHRISDRVVVMVPYMRANNPISKTNWEGTGVEPDVKCTADESLEMATGLAHEAIERRHSDE